MSDNPEALTAYIAMLERSKSYFLGDGVGCRLDRKTLLDLLRAALAQQAAAPTGDLTVPPPMPEPDGWRYWHKTDSLKLAVVSKRMDPSLDGAREYDEQPLVTVAKVLARDAEWAGRVAAARQAATPAPAEPVAIDYEALIAYCSKKYRWAQGTPRCSAFAKGAEWMRDQIAAPPATLAAPQEEA